MKINFYYQIDYIDDAELANYISTFTSDEFKEAQKHYWILQNALNCYKKAGENIRFVLDKYAYIEDDSGDAIDDTDTLVAQILPKLEM